VVCVGPDGTDTCIGVEAFAFSDGTFSLYTLLNTVAVESFGATRLKSDGVLYFLRDGADEGPGLSYLGAAFIAGQFGAWTPIGAEASGAGYLVVWQNGTADQYIVWATDADADFSALASGVISGASTTLRQLEASFDQDLNGNGILGV
jgi:serralysin